MTIPDPDTSTSPGSADDTSGVVDVHAHYRQPHLPVRPAPSWQSAERRADHERKAEIAGSFARIAEETEGAGITTRVLSLPASSRFESFDTGPSPRAEIVELNDYLAEGVRTHPDRLAGFATVDAFTGEDGAAEARRAVTELGLAGIVVDSAKADALLGDPSTVPTLQEAAALGVAVFVHPTGTSLTDALIAQAGQLGSSYGRGLANGSALLSLVHRGLLDSIPGLRVIFTSLGIGSLGILGVWRERGGLAAGDGRWQVFFDTMGFDPQNVGFLVSVLGPERVVIGSDWPHQVDPTPERVSHALDLAALAGAGQQLVRADNADALLRRLEPAVQGHPA